ncbi:hypothetical protein [Arenicella chitinivorans]|nr:hypothetical protein [Arenicella chitinivorans]
MKIPPSMESELSKWNNGAGIDLEAWLSCMGNFSLATAYVSVFNPQFVAFENYIFQTSEPLDEQAIENIRGFEAQEGATPKSVEWVINHLHIVDIHHRGCDDISSDKLIEIGNALKEIYEAKLAFLFPGKPCTVDFFIPENSEDYDDYQLSFWQKSHEKHT